MVDYEEETFYGSRKEIELWDLDRELARYIEETIKENEITLPENCYVRNVEVEGRKELAGEYDVYESPRIQLWGSFEIVCIEGSRKIVVGRGEFGGKARYSEISFEDDELEVSLSQTVLNKLGKLKVKQ